MTALKSLKQEHCHLSPAWTAQQDPMFFFKFTHDKPSEFLVGESLSVANILRTHKNQTTNQPTKRKKKPKPQDMFSSLIMSLTFSTQPPPPGTSAALISISFTFCPIP